MAKKRYTAEQSVAKSRESETELSKGASTTQVCKKVGVSEQTYSRWRREYGGRKMEQAKRLKLLERENARLKKVVADQEFDIAILKEVSYDGVLSSTCGGCAECRSAGHVGLWGKRDRPAVILSRFRATSLDWRRA